MIAGLFSCGADPRPENHRFCSRRAQVTGALAGAGWGVVLWLALQMAATLAPG
jgi:hypothetical protein